MSKTLNSKTINAAVLAATLLFAGAGTASADEVSLCEYWHGAAGDTCVSAFALSPALHNEAKGQGCKMKRSGGWPHWLDRDISSLNPDNLNDYQRDRLAKMKENMGHLCKCNVSFQCVWKKTLRGPSDPVVSSRTTNHECTATPEVLRSMTYNEGELKPGC